MARGQRPGRAGHRSRGSSLTWPRARARSFCTEAAPGTATTLSAWRTAATLASTELAPEEETNPGAEHKPALYQRIMDPALMIRQGVHDTINVHFCNLSFKVVLQQISRGM